jgi:predicted RNA binding protein YcfA (HicA-like mRNA interferase family)
LKRRDLVKAIEAMGCTLVRHGHRHGWYTNPKTRRSQPIPRHREINERLARSILKKLGGD